MKIAIISINAHTKVLNFASPLHSVAFWQFLADHGIDATIIDYKPNYYRNFDARHPLHYYEKHPDSNPETQKRNLEKWSILYREREVRFDRFEEFIQTYYHKTDLTHTADTLDEIENDFDCYICATDVIWKHNKKAGFDRGFFLACKSMEGKKKIAYAASRGACKYTPEQAQEFFAYISDIDYISVREKSLQNYIRHNSDLPVSLVLDPVFLQEKEFYEKMAVPPADRNYILIYLAMEKADDLVKTAITFARRHRYKIIELSEYPEHHLLAEGVDYKFVYDIGVEDWLGYMIHAEYIFTNSFHACCFSIIFKKEFFAGKRAGDKIDCLLERFALTHRRIKGYNPNAAEELSMMITDYRPIEELRKKYVKESSDFILSAIRNLETGNHTNYGRLLHDTFSEISPPASENSLCKKIRKLLHKK